MSTQKTIAMFAVLCLIALGLGYWIGPPKKSPSDRNDGNLKGKETAKNETDRKEPELLCQGLVAYYPFNGNAKDESENSNDFTVKGATLTTDRHGNADRAYAFDGVNSYMEAPNHPSLRLTQSTISIWVNPFSFWTTPILMKDKHQPEHYALWLHPPPRPPYWIFRYKGQLEPASVGYEKPLVLDSYTMLTLTVDDQMMRVFLDGKLTSEKKVNGAPYIGQESLFLGFSGDKITYRKFHGIIDDIRIYNRALSEAEVKTLYEFEKTE